MMRIGTTTMVFWNEPVSTGIRRIADVGFDTVEIWIEHVDRFSDVEEYGRVAKALADTGLAASVHGPILDLNITSPNEGIRQESLRQQVRAMRLAREMGAELLVLHPGRITTKWDDMDEHRTLQRRSLEFLLEEAARLGLLIGLENMEVRSPLHTVKTARQMQEVIADLPERFLGVTLDIAHLGDQQACIDFIRALAPRIRHVHISDARNEGEPHVPFGTGVLDLPGIVQELRAHDYDGMLSLEVFIPAGNVAMLRDEFEKVKAAL